MSTLYTTDILRLAVGSAAYPPLTDPQAHIERRATPCGSTIALDMDCDAAGRVVAVGLAVHACAMGQAAAALFAAGAVNRDAAELVAAADHLRDWLNGARDEAPDWPGIAVLAPARTYPARHGAIRLPFEAGAAAAAEAGRAAA